MPLINLEINLMLIWSANCVISAATGATIFAIADAKLYHPAVIWSIQDNTRVL